MHFNTYQTREVPDKVAFAAMTKIESKYESRCNCISIKKGCTIKKRTYEKCARCKECKVTTFYRKRETPSSANKAFSL